MKSNKVLKIFLADLGHTYYTISPATIPVGIGYIKAKLLKEYGTSADVRLFKYPEKLLSALETEQPDFVGFGIVVHSEF